VANPFTIFELLNGRFYFAPACIVLLPARDSRLSFAFVLTGLDIYYLTPLLLTFI